MTNQLLLESVRSYVGIKCIDDTQMYVTMKDGANLYVTQLYLNGSISLYSIPLSFADTVQVNKNMVVFYGMYNIQINRVSDLSFVLLAHSSKIQKIIPISDSYIVIHNADNTLNLYDINR